MRRFVQALMVSSALALAPATWVHAVTGDRVRPAAEVTPHDVRRTLA